MRSGIKEFQPRQPLDRQLGAGTLNQILRELESLRITRVVNGTFRKLPGGTEITVAPQRGGGGAAQVTPQPWDLISRRDPESDPENPSYLVTVRPGTVNSVLPSNWNEDSEAKDVQCNNSDLYYGKAVITTDGQSITGVEVALDTTPPAEQSPQLFAIESSVEILFGLFRAGSSYRVVGPGDISLRSVPWLVSSPDSARSFGQLPYDIYYQLA